MQEVSVKIAKTIAYGIAESKSASVDVVVLSSKIPNLLQLPDSSWISWCEFARWLRGYDESIWAPVDWRKVGELSLVPQQVPLASAVFRMAVSLRSGYWLAAKWFGPSQFRVVATQFEDIGPNKIRETLTIPPELDPCPQAFQIFEGTLAIMPKTVLGMEPSVVESQISGRIGIYDITLPKKGTGFRSVFFYLRNFLKWKYILQELTRQQTALTIQTTKLARERAEFKIMMSSFPDGIMIHRGGQIVYVNEMMCRFLNCAEASELIGKSCLDNVALSDRENVQNRIAKFNGNPSLINKPSDIVFEKMHTREPILGECTSMALTFEGEPCVLIVTRDLSERRAFQAQLLEADRLASLGHLAAGVGHEINNPLCYVMMKLEALSEAAKLKSDLELLNKLKPIEDGLIRIQGIVKELKSVSAEQAKRIKNEGEVASIEPALRSAILIAQNEIQHRAVLDVELPELPSVNADEAQLSQVFLNLLINAAQAIEPGRAQHNKIQVRGSVKNEMVQIQISDTGRGISEEAKQNVFKPFYTTKESGQGTGLGLSICQSIVERFNGRIEWDSTLGKGSNFRVLFPIQKNSTKKSLDSNPADAQVLELAESTNADPALAATGSKLAKGRVLIIDDDEVLLETLIVNIAPFHHTVGVTTAVAGLALLRQGEKFDLVICDLMMPNLGGIEFYELLQKEIPQVCQRLIFLTGGSFTPKTNAFLARPDIRTVDKPIRRGALLKIIAEQVHASQL